MQIDLIKFNSTIELALAFIVCAFIVVISGFKLSIYAEALSHRYKIDSALIGLIFLAFITSLPELIVSISSLLNEPLEIGADLAIGNLLGSNLFNIFILGLLGLFYSKIFQQIKIRNLHQKSLIQSLLLLSITYVAYIYSNSLSWPAKTSWVLFLSPIFYLFFIKKFSESSIEEDIYINNSIKSLTEENALYFHFKLFLICFVIIISGIQLSSIGGNMALPKSQGGFDLDASFIGLLFLAFSTSLPEFIIAISCLKQKLPDMAIGNIIGSNMFNLIILCLGDILLKEHILFEGASNDYHSLFGFIFVISVFTFIFLKNLKKIKIYSLCIILTYLIALLVEA